MLTQTTVLRTLLIGALSAIVFASFGTSAFAAEKAKARIWYDSQTKKSINIVYVNLPPASRVRFVNATSGKKYPPKSLPLSGNGTYSVPIGNLPSGAYYILAENSKGKYLSQTVQFYTSKESVPVLADPVL